MASPQLPFALSASRTLPRAARHLVLLGIAVSVAAISSLSPAAADPVAAACGSFQARVNNAKAGSTITIPKGCTYHESVSINKKLTIKAYGVVVDGDNARSTGIAVHASGVRIYGLTVKRVNSSANGGAVWTTGVSSFEFRKGVIRDSSTVCIYLNGGSGHVVADSRLSGCGKDGFITYGVSRTTFARNNIYGNNTSLANNPGIEGGAGKIGASDRVTFTKNKVHDNGGVGIWFDVGSTNATIKYNRVYRNTHAGIFFEIGRGAKIYGNKVWSNGHTGPAWGYGAGIQVSSSDGASVHDNVVAWNARGISVISQNRGSVPHQNNVVYDNVIVSATNQFVSGFYDDHGGSLWAASNGNKGFENRYWIGGSKTSNERFIWNGSRATLSAYNATLGERGGKYLTKAQRNKILKAASIPTKP